MENDNLLIWTEKSKTEILKTAVFTVNETESISPEGSSGNYIVLDAKDWVVVIPSYGENFLMVKQWRHGEKRLSIEFPGGVIEKGEKPEIGAKRELKEETGFTAKTLFKLGEMNPNPALFSNHVHFFLAENLENQGEQSLDSDEYLNLIKIPKNEVYKNMGNAEYCHALMASAMEIGRAHV